MTGSAYAPCAAAARAARRDREGGGAEISVSNSVDDPCSGRRPATLNKGLVADDQWTVLNFDERGDGQ